jgi:RHS repeat-associated protein
VYDDVGNVIEKTDYQNEVTEYRYDSTNRLVSLRNQAYLQVSYHYDPAGRLLNRILSNRARTDYQYDDDNRLEELTNRSVSDKLSMTRTYGYDRIGNIISITDTSGTVDFTFDPLYRLTNADYPGTANDVSYTYDDVGNRLTMAGAGGTLYYIYNNNGNRLDEVRQGSAGGPIQYRYVYDDNGNRTEKRDGSDTVLHTYLYDQKNRVTTLMTATDTYTFQYDPNDYRIRKSDGTDANQYLMEGEHYEAIYHETDTIKAKFLRGVVVDEIVNGYYYDQGTKTNYTFHHDQLGSVVALSGHNGDEMETTKFGPFGDVIDSTGTSPNALKYTGRELDSETGLYYYRARYYDPEIGRFLSEDPLGFEAGVNFYTYVGNNPVNFNDPSGHLADILIDAGFIAYDIYSLVKNPGWDTAAALGLDVVGAAVPFVTGLGQAYRTEKYLTEVANYADKLVIPTGTSAKVAGTLKHSEAARIIDTGSSGLLSEISFKGGSEVSYGTRGSVRLDALSGTPENITRWYDFKFGDSGLNSSRIGQIQTNIPGGASVPFTEIRPGVLPTSPSSYSGLGAAYNLGTDLFGGSSAAGGYVLYPNKPNTNMMQSVYSK